MIELDKIRTTLYSDQPNEEKRAAYDALVDFLIQQKQISKTFYSPLDAENRKASAKDCST